MSTAPASREQQGDNSLNLNEAAWVTGVSSRTINAIIDRGEIEVRPTRRRTKREPRCLGVPEVVYLVLRRELSATLSAQAKRELYEELKRGLSDWQVLGRTERARDREDEISLADGLVKVEIESTCERVFQGWLTLAKANELVISDPEVRGGDPIVKGTRIPVSLIADLRVQGASEEEILEDYPSLTKEKLQAVSAYLTTHPRRGRPRKAPWRSPS